MFASFQMGLFRTIGTVVADCRAVVRRLRHDKSGNVAMLFGLLAIPLFGIMGLAVDMGRAYHVGVHTQGALDSAALAAARVGQVEKTNMLTKASAAASAYYDQAKPTDVVKTSIAFAPNSQNTEFTVTASSWVRTPFLSVLKWVPGANKAAASDAPEGCKDSAFQCTKLVSTATAQICLNCSSDEGTNIELAMMLDVTGSMAGTRITDLKAAAKDLVDIVVWDDQSKWTSKIALVPFSNAVNVGTYFSKITGLPDRTDNDGSSSYNINFPSSCFNSKGKLTCSLSTYNKFQYIAKNAPCVVEREANGLTIFASLTSLLGQNTDATPGPSGGLLGNLTGLLIGSPLPSWNQARSMDTSDSASATDQMATTCTPSNAIVPLTTDRTKLKATIDGFTASGSTAGQLGTAFAWYMLSPNWAKVWPTESQPTPYGTAKVKKIAILMTDGEFNTLQGNQYNDGSTEATKAANITKTLCTNMKKKLLKTDPNIEIFTVGFQVNSTAKSMLKSCATDDQHYYDASTGDALRQAFRDIALKISKLRLTN
jgi:Flp pilus assembly protein TadG